MEIININDPSDYYSVLSDFGMSDGSIPYSLYDGSWTTPLLMFERANGDIVSFSADYFAFHKYNAFVYRPSSNTFKLFSSLPTFGLMNFSEHPDQGSAYRLNDYLIMTPGVGGLYLVAIPDCELDNGLLVNPAVLYAGPPNFEIYAQVIIGSKLFIDYRFYYDIYGYDSYGYTYEITSEGINLISAFHFGILPTSVDNGFIEGNYLPDTLDPTLRVNNVQVSKPATKDYLLYLSKVEYGGTHINLSFSATANLYDASYIHYISPLFSFPHGNNLLINVYYSNVRKYSLTILTKDKIVNLYLPERASIRWIPLRFIFTRSGDLLAFATFSWRPALIKLNSVYSVTQAWEYMNPSSVKVEPHYNLINFSRPVSILGSYKA